MRILTIILIVITFVALGLALPAFAQGGAVNIDPDFDKYDADPNGPWQIFKISNPGPNIWRTEKGGEGGPGNAGRGGPALWIYRDTAYDGGVYQVVKVTPGKGYHFEVAWAVVRFNGGNGTQDHDALLRSVGIDPYGGTNPLAPSVKWSGEYGGNGKFAPSESGDLQVDEYARSDKITVFLRAHNSFSGGRAEVFFDHAILTENTSMGTIVVSPPTATSAPVTATRTRTQTAARIAQAPGATATNPPPTATLEPTATETSRPLPTRTARPTATPEPENNSFDASGIVTLLLVVGGLGAFGIGLLVFGFIVFRILGRHS